MNHSTHLGRRQVHFAPAVSIHEESEPFVLDRSSFLSIAKRRRSNGKGEGDTASANSTRPATLLLRSLSICLSLFLAGLAVYLPGSPLQGMLPRLGFPSFNPSPTAVGQLTSHAVHATIQQAIRIALESTIQRHNFALASQGALIVSALTSQSIPPDPDNDPDSLLEEDLSTESCWFFVGRHGQVGVRLPHHQVAPTHIALDVVLHLETLALAPRRVVVWGTVDGDANRHKYNTLLRTYRERVAHLGSGPSLSLGYTFLALADFEYDPAAAFPLQTFRVAPLVVASQITFGVLVVEVKSNWGGNKTVICSIRVHGDVGLGPM